MGKLEFSIVNPQENTKRANWILQNSGWLTKWTYFFNSVPHLSQGTKRNSDATEECSHSDLTEVTRYKITLNDGWY